VWLRFPKASSKRFRRALRRRYPSQVVRAKEEYGRAFATMGSLALQPGRCLHQVCEKVWTLPPDNPIGQNHPHLN
jgi:hypothetical protein